MRAASASVGSTAPFVGLFGLHLLETKKTLDTAIVSFNATTQIRGGFDSMQSDFSRFRMGIWSVVFASLTSAKGAADVENAKWRLVEIPAPRMKLDVDHRVGDVGQRLLPGDALPLALAALAGPRWAHPTSRATTDALAAAIPIALDVISNSFKQVGQLRTRQPDAEQRHRMDGDGSAGVTETCDAC